MKKSVFLLILCFVLSFALCGCSAKSFNKIQSNLTDKGYSVNLYDQKRIDDMQSTMSIYYDASGKLKNALYAQKDGKTVFVVEFEKKDSLDKMYRSVKEELTDSQTVDFAGNILVYGDKEAVKAALG